MEDPGHNLLSLLWSTAGNTHKGSEGKATEFHSSYKYTRKAFMAKGSSSPSSEAKSPRISENYTGRTYLFNN